jgi:RNA polymerase sigma-70 factor (ECF subfamily)
MQILIAALSLSSGQPGRDEDDVRILERIARGEEPAIAELYDRYGRLLFSFGMRILRSQHEAEDLLQEIFLQVWNKVGAYEQQKGSVYTWLVTMTRNRAIDRLRSSSGKLQRMTVDLDQVMLVAESHASNPHAYTVFGEEQRSMVEALKRLTTDQQQVIGLAYYEGYSQSQIAELLKIPLGTVKTRMRKGMMDLREMLKEIHA